MLYLCCTYIWEETMFSQNPSSIKCFHKILFCGSLRTSLSTGKDSGRGKDAYIWISLDPRKRNSHWEVFVTMSDHSRDPSIQLPSQLQEFFISLGLITSICFCPDCLHFGRISSIDSCLHGASCLSIAAPHDRQWLSNRILCFRTR